MDTDTGLALTQHEPCKPQQAKPAKKRLEPRRPMIRKTVQEIVDDVQQRYPVVMARLAE